MEPASVTEADVRDTVRALGLAGRALCVHASLRSFGWVEGGARTVVDAILAEGCTLLVPTFSGAAFEVWPDPPDLIPRNGWPAESRPERGPESSRIYSPASTEIDADMGAIPAAVLATPGRVRGDHPLDSFAAVGPLAHALVDGQGPRDVYAPLEALVASHGFVVLMGVGFERMTLLHLAEQRAGRALFVRWALGAAGEVVRARVGGCSEGFPRLAPILAPLTSETMVGASRWLAMPAADALSAAAAARGPIPTSPTAAIRPASAATTRCSAAQWSSAKGDEGLGANSSAGGRKWRSGSGISIYGQTR